MDTTTGRSSTARPSGSVSPPPYSSRPALIDFIGDEDAASYNPDYVGTWCAEVLLDCKDTFELGQWAERVAAFLRSRGAPRGTVLVAEFGREWAVKVHPDGK